MLQPTPQPRLFDHSLPAKTLESVSNFAGPQAAKLDSLGGLSANHQRWLNAMKWKGIDFGYILRYMLAVLIGYLTVFVFIMSFVTASQAKNRLGLPASLSEVTALIIAAIITAPIILPFAWKRLSKVKIGDLEIDLLEVSAKVKLIVADELRDVQRLAMESSVLPNLTEKLATAISEVETSSIVEVEFGIGKPPWWSTRLYLLAALAEDYTDIRQLIFLESQQGRDRIYVGSVVPVMIRQALAVDDSRLSEAYEAAMKEPVLDQDASVPTKRVAWIAQNYIEQLNWLGGEEQIKQIVTREFLDRCRVMTGNSIEWNGGPPPMWLIHDIIEHPERYIALVKTDGKLSLVVDRMKLAEHIAKISLRHQLT